jgi:hypothetical protein
MNEIQKYGSGFLSKTNSGRKSKGIRMGEHSTKKKFNNMGIRVLRKGRIPL